MDAQGDYVDITNSTLTRIRNAIKDRLEAKGMKVSALADMVGIDRFAMSRILSGKRVIYAEELISFILVLDIPMEDVLGEDEWQNYVRRNYR